jgi:hypothetical protein
MHRTVNPTTTVYVGSNPTGRTNVLSTNLNKVGAFDILCPVGFEPKEQCRTERSEYDVTEWGSEGVRGYPSAQHDGILHESRRIQPGAQQTLNPHARAWGFYVYAPGWIRTPHIFKLLLHPLVK